MPTANRAAFLRRWLGFMASEKLAAPVLITDGGTEENFAANQLIIQEYGQGLSIKHVAGHPTDVFERLRVALEQVDTKYTMIAADDDFLVVETLDLLERHLEQNPACAAVHGWSSVFEMSGEHGIPGKVAECVQLRDLSFPTAGERLLRFLGDYRPTWHSMARTEDMRRNFAGAARFSGDWRFGELLVCCLSAIDGAVQQIPAFHTCRQANPNSTSKDRGEYHWVASRDWSQGVGEFLQILTQRLMERDGLNGTAGNELAQLAFLNYISRNLSAYEPTALQRAASMEGLSFLTDHRPRSLWKRARRFARGRYFSMKCRAHPAWKRMTAAMAKTS